MAERRRFDPRVILCIVVVIVAVIIAIAINANHTEETVDKLASIMDVDDGDLNIDWNRYETIDVNLTGPYEINKSGIYHLTGVTEEGMVTINTGHDDTVKLILDNVTIRNNKGPAIYCSDADDLVIEVVGNNYLSDGQIYEGYDEDVTGAIYSKADTSFNGDGVLYVNGYYQDGIVSKDDLNFRSGIYIVNTEDDAIRGKDSVYISGGSFDLVAGADAIKSTNEIDMGKGFVYINEGEMVISAEAKGVKATNIVLVKNSSLDITSFDDALHSDGHIGIAGAYINIESGDDGIHANKKLLIGDSTTNINIKKAYEGLEAQVVIINDGTISINANDDGINAGGGADGSSIDKGGMFNGDSSCILSINGGEIYINASGDGIDSNGYLLFNGGNTIIDGPTNDGNGALDAGTQILFNGGQVIAVGASGMASGLGESSRVYNVSIYFEKQLGANTDVTIRDSDQNVIINHISAKSFNHMAVGSTQFEPGKTYKILVNNDEYKTFTISDVMTTVGDRPSGGLDRPDDGKMMPKP